MFFSLFWFLGLLALSGQSSNYSMYSMDKMIMESQPSMGQPHIDPDHSGDVTAVVGSHALLNCRVYNLGNRTVRLEDI